MFTWITSEGPEFKGRLDLVNAEDLNCKMAAVLNHLVAVHGLYLLFPCLRERHVGGACSSLKDCAVVMGRVDTEACLQRAISLRAVADNLVELQELFAVGTGLQSVISRVEKYVAAGVFLVEFKPTAALLVAFESGSGRITVPEGSLGEQVCAAICVRDEPMG